MRDIQQQRQSVFLEFLNSKEPMRILDVGCQSGDLCNQLKLRGHEPYGIDVVPDLITSAKENYPQITFEIGDCENGLPFEDKLFDMVWAGDVIEHIRFTDVFINEINRVLKPGGVFALTTPMHNRLKNIVICLRNFENHFNPEFPHLRFYTLKSLKLVLARRGFRTLKVKYIGRIPPLAKSMFVASEKVEDKSALSEHRY
ncbi:MAG: class I SAM-dependent methyltransferase [Phycisphaerales bacterium]|nr:MAG: class I SAM-dependent methyltransferase [Phycisphaerales bacterium]